VYGRVKAGETGSAAAVDLSRETLASPASSSSSSLLFPIRRLVVFTSTSGFDVSFVHLLGEREKVEHNAIEKEHASKRKSNRKKSKKIKKKIKNHQKRRACSLHTANE